MHMGSFELTVMFFEMTNLPATFQEMINKILRDIINERKVVAFMDDMLVETETEEEHNKIVKEYQHKVVKTQGSTKVVVQKELNRISCWIPLVQ